MLDPSVGMASSFSSPMPPSNFTIFRDVIAFLIRSIIATTLGSTKKKRNKIDYYTMMYLPPIDESRKETRYKRIIKY